MKDLFLKVATEFESFRLDTSIKLSPNDKPASIWLNLRIGIPKPVNPAIAVAARVACLLRSVLVKGIY